MSSSISPTVDDILNGLGITTFAGDVVLGGIRSISTSVGVAAPIETLMVIDTGATGETTATVTLTTGNNPLTVGLAGRQGVVGGSVDGLTVTFSGTLDQVNADLRLLSYVSGSAGNDSVTLSVTDAAGNSKSGSFSVAVLPSAATPGAPTSANYVQPTDIGQDATLSGGNQIYTADDGTDTVTATDTASSVTGGGASSTVTLLQNGGSYDFTNKAGSATVVANSAPGTISGGAAGSTLVAFLQDQPTSYVGGLGHDELIGGGGNMTVTGGGGGSLTVFGGTGTLDFRGGHGHETVVGGAGAETIQAAASGGTYFGGAGGSQMTAVGAGSFLIGAVDGDVLAASGFGGDGLVAGAGNETLNGAGSTWQNVLFGGTGRDQVMLGAGRDTFVGGSGTVTVQMGTGSAALFTGSGAELFSFDAAHTGGATPGSDMIVGFRDGIDHLRLAAGLSVTHYASAGGMTSLVLTNGTEVHLAGVSGALQGSLFG